MYPISRVTFTICFLIVSLSSYAQIQEKNLEEVNHLIKKARSFNQSQSDSSLIYAKQALQLSLKREYDVPLIECYLLLTNYYWNRDDYKSALEYAYKAEELTQNSNYKKQYAHTILIIASIHIEIGDTNQKFNSLFKALDLFTQLEDIKGKSHAYMSLSGAHYKYGNVEKALEYCQKSIDESKQINDLNGISRTLNNMGAMYEKLDNFEKAKSYYLKSVNIAHKTHNVLLEGIVYLNLGQVYSSLNDIDSSYHYLMLAMEIFKSTHNAIRLADCHIQLANNHLKTRNYNQGFEHAKIALEIGKKNQRKISIASSLKILQELYKTTDDLENAYKYNILYHSVRDSIRSKNVEIRLEQMEMKYTFEHTLLEKESKQKHKRLIYITIFTVIVALMSLALITIYFKSKMRVARSIQEKVKLESELEIKHKELTTNTMFLIKTNKTLNDIRIHLIEALNNKDLLDTQLAINSIINDIKQATRSKIWKEFEIRFQQVHNNFNENLLAKFPKLTALDLRLCALLRLNLTTKEISELTGQRTASLEIARSRLRKKLGITNRSTNLIVFLSSF